MSHRQIHSSEVWPSANTRTQSRPRACAHSVDHRVVRTRTFPTSTGAPGATMTPTQLRAFVAVIRHGSVKDAGTDLGVSPAAISLHVAQLRKELGDQLVGRSPAQPIFQPLSCVENTTY